MDHNPYEAPRYETSLSSLTYFQPLSTRLKLREYRRMSKNWFELLLGILLKILRIRISMTFAFADTRHFQRISPQDLSVRAREQIKPIADQALDLGLQYAFSYTLPTVGTIEGAAATFFGNDGRSILVIAYARTWTQVVVDEKIVSAFVSRLANGTAIVTSAAKGDLDSPPHVLVETHPGSTMHQICERHAQRLNEAASPVIEVHDGNQLEGMLREYEQENFAFNVERGVYVPVGQRELARLHRLASAAPGVPRSKTVQRFQGIELVCWIAMAVSLFMFAQGQPANVSQTIFRLSILLAAGAGIAIIWLIRGVVWMQSKAEE